MLYLQMLLVGREMLAIYYSLLLASCAVSNQEITVMPICRGVVCCHGSCSEALAVTQRQLEDLASRGRELEEQQAVTVAEAARLREQV